MKVREATQQDRLFLVRLACDAYRDVVTRQFGRWDDEEQAERFAAKVARLPFEVGELEGVPVAAVSSSVHADHVFLNELLVLPQYQGRGLGGELLEREIGRARRLGLALRLHTLRLNRARRLFERHGLVVTARGEDFIDMERGDPQAQPTGLLIRPETPADVDDIRAINVAAFEVHAYGRQTEHLIVDALRAAGALAVSLVAVTDGRAVGHIAFSQGIVGAAARRWYVAGPVAVLPECQRRGIGSALVEAGLAELRDRGAAGCVLVGDPHFYERFGFAPRAGLAYEGVPDEFVLGLPFGREIPTGTIVAHTAFATGPEP